jgi:hypothetical protein
MLMFSKSNFGLWTLGGTQVRGQMQGQTFDKMFAVKRRGLAHGMDSSSR